MDKEYTWHKILKEKKENRIVCVLCQSPRGVERTKLAKLILADIFDFADSHCEVKYEQILCWHVNVHCLHKFRASSYDGGAAVDMLGPGG